MKLKNLLFLTTIMLFSAQIISAATIRGKVLDKTTNEPLLGATIMVQGTTTGTATSFDGSFEIGAKKDQILVISYISYLTQEITVDKGQDGLTIALEPDAKVLASVEVVTKANLETEANLQNERIASHIAIENLGVKEMSLKGLSNAEDGVKKMTGISIADAGEIFVRGLGDRYSLTTMNGVPVASPNPDNKLIPLDVFPSSAIQNITVSKVYRVDAFADYSGALIDIATKNNVTENFFNVSLSVGGNTATTGKTFYTSDRKSLFTTPKLPSVLSNVDNKSYADYMKDSTTDPFESGFSATKSNALPDFGAQLGYGHEWSVGDDDLSLLITASLDNDKSTINDGSIMSLNRMGYIIDSYIYDSYSTTLDLSGLASVGYDFDKNNSVNYTMFYSRNVDDSYKTRYGRCEEGDDIYVANSVQRIYSVFNNQLNGNHKIGKKLSFDWTASYVDSSSSEPNRRQMIFWPPTKSMDYTLYVRDQFSTNRNYGDLVEKEWSGDVNFDYDLSEKSSIHFGGAYRDKNRDYESIMFSYDYTTDNGAYNPEFETVYDTDSQINQDHFHNGDIVGSLYNPSSTDYYAESQVTAAYVSADYQFSKLLVDLGVRLEDSKQSVISWTDTATIDDPTYSDLNGLDFFPALNLKYACADEHSLRFAASKTVTRPSFIEMAPFKYRESFGSAYLRGNGDIENGYNYNFDLRYEFFDKESSDMWSACVYYKYLDSPIERVQTEEGTSLVYSFMNSNSGYAAGLELEYRKQIMEDLRFNINGSFILTQVVLDENGGIYTETERQLQGASPYLVNADISYTLRSKQKRDSNTTFTLLYSLQGPRIDAVGIYDLHDVMQKATNNLDFVCSYSLNKKLSLSLKLQNLTNNPIVFTQEAANGVVYEVGRYKEGIDGSIGVSYKF